MSPYRRHTPPAAAEALDRLAVALQTYRAETQRIADQLAAAVVECIGFGATWGEVGKRLEISKQAAREHWGPYVERAAQPGNRMPSDAGSEPSGYGRGPAQ